MWFIELVLWKGEIDFCLLKGDIAIEVVIKGNHFTVDVIGLKKFQDMFTVGRMGTKKYNLMFLHAILGFSFIVEGWVIADRTSIGLDPTRLEIADIERE